MVSASRRSNAFLPHGSWISQHIHHDKKTEILRWTVWHFYFNPMEHTHTHTHIYIYIYTCMCVCVYEAMSKKFPDWVNGEIYTELSYWLLLSNSKLSPSELMARVQPFYQCQKHYWNWLSEILHRMAISCSWISWGNLEMAPLYLRFLSQEEEEITAVQIR